MTVRILVATHNRGKVAEIRRLLEGLVRMELVSLHDLPGAPHVYEDGVTFEENARKKATEIARATGMLTLADDSGLEVDALGGEPGVRSARFAGSSATDGENNRKLLSLLADLPPDERAARFRCCLALADPMGPLGDEVHFEHGVCEGRIVSGLRGRGGFGYDPLFVPHGEERTMAELSADEKNAISHRAEAARKMRAFLDKYLPEREHAKRLATMRPPGAG